MLALRLRYTESVLLTKAGSELARIIWTNEDRLTIRERQDAPDGSSQFVETYIDGLIKTIGDCKSYLDFELLGAKVVVSRDRGRDTLKIGLDSSDQLLSFIRYTLLEIVGSKKIVNARDNWFCPEFKRVYQEWVDSATSHYDHPDLPTYRVFDNGRVNRALVLRNRLLQAPYATKA